MEIQTSAQLAVKEAMRVTGCQTHAAIAARVGVSQNAVWKLIHGKSRTAHYKTALAFERATNGVVSRFRFLEEEQGGNQTETPNNGSTDAAGDITQTSRHIGSEVSEASSERANTHVGDSPAVG